MDTMPGFISPDQLDALVHRGRETSFVIIDVRTPKEYALDHIPGAVNVPVSGIDTHDLILHPCDRLVFYCRNGMRSKVAAFVAAEAGVPDDRIFNLTGGMAGYTGDILLDMPRLEIFSGTMSLDELLNTSMNLEKGAYLFYEKAAPLFEGTPVHPVMVKMADAEVAHAKIIFKVLNHLNEGKLDFKKEFQACSGDILEGGKSRGQIQSFIDRSTGDNRIDVLEFALDMEFSAYDLYKNSALTHKEPRAKKLFISLVQAEKKHISDMIHCIDICP
jgi:rhodanese-related sulfurtransferase/rubrerythrin